MRINPKKVITKKVYTSMLKPAALAITRMRTIMDEVEELLPEAMVGKVHERREGMRKMREIRNLADAGLKSFKHTDPWYRENVRKFREKNIGKNKSDETPKETND